MAFSLYSKIPMPEIDWDEESRAYLFCFFPAVGAVIALVLLLWTRVSDAAGFSIVMKSAVYVCIPFLLSGGIHFDGYLDVTDAVASYRDREERLAIMKDPHTGSFAVSMGIVWFVLFFGSTEQMLAGGLVVGCLIFVISRGLTGLLVMNLKNARPGGMLSSSTEKREKPVVNTTLVIWIGFSCFLMMCAGGARMAVPCVAGIIWCLIFTRFAIRRFGGITGDLAGYFLTWCELVMTITCAVLSAI